MGNSADGSCHPERAKRAEVLERENRSKTDENNPRAGRGRDL